MAGDVKTETSTNNDTSQVSATKCKVLEFSQISATKFYTPIHL